MRTPTKFVATFTVNGDEQEVMESPNRAKLVDLVRRTIKERTGDKGNGYFEIYKVYTDEERLTLSIPENRHGQIDQRTHLVNGKWKVETPFNEYF